MPHETCGMPLPFGRHTLLQFILGTAGTGKTTKLIQAVKDVVESGGRAVLLVPEQYSFASERRLHKELGPRLALEVEVLSFTRVCNAVFRRFGRLAGVAVSGAGKYMLMSVALDELRDKLRVYRKSAAGTAFLQALVAACAEFKTAGLPPERLLEIADACEEGPLRDKLSELGAVYAAYQALLERGYTDPDDDLLRATKMLASHNYFGEISVFVDGFTTFMAGEFVFLAQVVAQAKDVTFAMTADSLDDQSGGTGVFSPAKSAVMRLIRYARQAGVAVAAPQLPEEPCRYRSRALRHISKEFLQPAAKPFGGASDGAVHLTEAADLYQEIEQVAARIAGLVRENGYRYSEIAVVARDTEPYERALLSVFARYDIPFFVDAREDVENLPLISGLLSALDAVRSGFDTDAVLAYAKSPITGLAAEPVAALENYCYSWGVRGSVWGEPFSNNPAGLAEGLSDADRALLDQINQVREAVATPLLHLRDALGRTDGKRFAKGVYEFLVEVNAAENLNAHAQGLEQGMRESFLDQSAQLWEILMDILDVFGAVLGGVALSAARACELFRLAVGTAEVAGIPQTLDQVLVGMADRIRPGEVRAVFVIGAAEGVFPAQVGAAGLFSDNERQRMIELGAELSPPSLHQSVLERYYAYFAITLPSERLWASYARRDSMGAEQRPSVILHQLLALFPALVYKAEDSQALIAGEKSAFRVLARHYREDTPLTASLLQSLQADRTDALARMYKAAARPPHKLSVRRSAQELFGGKMRFSPSRVERYYRCPFSYFAADGLALKKRRKVEFTPLESGSVVHNVLQVMAQRHGGKGLAALNMEQLTDEVREVITDYLAQRVNDQEALPARFKYLFTRLAGTLARLLAHLGREFAQSAFEPVAFELPIGQGDGVEPLRLVTSEGVPVTVEGIVDRVDVMEKNGRRYVRVVDYKSGGKEFKLHDILYGLNMQMLLYLFTISENGRGDLADAVPAGVLYMPVREKYVAAGRNEDTAAAREKQWRMNGLLLEDEEVLRGMERDLAGVFIPAKLTKSGAPDARSSLASAAEMGALAQKVRDMIKKMVSSLIRGGIEALPVDSGDFDTCAYCDYRSVCGVEPGDPVKSVEAVDRVRFFKILEEERQNG